MKNEYEIRGTEVYIFINSKKHGKFETKISLESLEKVKSHPNSWYVIYNRCTDSFYVVSKVLEDGKKRMVQLHRLITDSPSGMVVDHINHDTLNNTISNLRVATPSENQQNRIKSNSNNKCGVRGVYREGNKYRVQIMVKSKLISVGRFETIEEAGMAAVAARLKYMPFTVESI